MRGRKTSQTTMLTRVAPEQRVPRSHPLRRIEALADAALAALAPTFDVMYAESGRPSVPPERLLESTLLMAFYSVRSDRLFCEQLDCNLLSRWFLDRDMEEVFGWGKTIQPAPDLQADARVGRPPHPASPPAARGERRKTG